MLFDTPILTPRASPGDPITMRTDHVKGRAGTPRVQVQSRVTPSSLSDPERDQRDMQMARGVGRLLHATYEGHFWSVEVDSRQGICLVGIVLLLGNWKYKIPLTQLTPAAVIRAGGEILERFNIPRSSIDVAAFVNAKQRAVSRASDKPPGS